MIHLTLKKEGVTMQRYISSCKQLVFHCYTLLQYHNVLASVLTLFVILPISDLPFIGTLIVTIYSLVLQSVIFPAIFADTFLLELYAMYSETEVL